MAGANKWRTKITTNDLLRDMEKRILHEERRPLVRTASDLLGPGIGPFANQIYDWNEDVTAFNGFWWSEPGAQHAPDTTSWWMGRSEATKDGFGIQWAEEFREIVDDTVPQVVWKRRFYNPGGGGQRAYSAWKRADPSWKRVGIDIISADTTPSGSAQNVGTVRIPEALWIDGLIFRATWSGSVQNDVAAAFTDVAIRWGGGAVVGTSGQQSQAWLVDHRQANRRQGGTVVSELPAWPLVGFTVGIPYNVVAVLLPGSGNAYCPAASNRQTQLVLDAYF